MASPSSDKEESALEGFGTRWWRMVAGSDTWLLAAAIAIGVLTACANVAFHWAVDGAHDSSQATACSGYAYRERGLAGRTPSSS